MKKVMVLVCVITALLTAAPSLGGGRGLFRVSDARTEGDGYLLLSFNTMTRMVDVGDSKVYLVDLLFPQVTYSPFDFFEVFAWTGGIFQYDTAGEVTFDWHDKTVGGKFAIPWLPVLKLGAIGEYTWERGDEMFYDVAILPSDGFSYGGCATLEFSELASRLPVIIANYKRLPNSLDTVMVNYGLAAMLEAENLTLFAEIYSEQLDGNDILEKDGRIRITPGIKIRAGHFTYNAGVDFRLSNENTIPDYQLLLGITYKSPFLKPPVAQTGTIAGKVSDASTKKPIAAIITFPETPKMTAVDNNPLTGVFSVEKVPANVITVEVIAEGYNKEAVAITVKPNEVTTYNFDLKPLVTVGIIAGKVYEAQTMKPLAAKITFPGTDISSITTDASTGTFRIDNVKTGIIEIQAEKKDYFTNAKTVQINENQVTNIDLALAPSAFKSTVVGKVTDKEKGQPLKAEVSFPGTAVKSVWTDAQTGIYKTDLPVGTHTIQLKAEGYISQSFPIVVEKEKTLEKDFQLIKVGAKITLKGVFFETNKATLKPESHVTLDDAAKILKDNPKITVEIQGHTDNVGSDEYNQTLSQRRAQSVVDYLVKIHGIEVNRLTAMGYGESKPIASNDTPEGRSLNRRVEFVVLQEK